MAIFKVGVFKRLNEGDDLRYWSNIYRVDAGSLDDALDKAVSIANIEQAVHKDYVRFSRVTAIEDVVDPPEGASRVLTGSGDVTGDFTLVLPRFNTVRCVFSDGVGRPDQKYLRLPLEEGDVVSGTISVDLSNALALDYVAPITELGFVVSSDQVSYTEGTVVPAIQMRQISWHRRTRPGFHRGYIPNS